MYIANEHIPVKKTAPSPRQAINLAPRQGKQAGRIYTGQAKVEKASKRGPPAGDDATRRNHATLPIVISAHFDSYNYTLCKLKGVV